MQQLFIGRLIASLVLFICFGLANPAGASIEPSETQTELQPKQVNEQSVVSRYVRIPIYYMTDRQLRHPNFGPERLDESDNIYKLNCGELNYVMENYHQKDFERLKDKLGWQPATKPRKLAFTTKPLEFGKDDDVYEGFARVISEVAQKSGSNEIFICVHGFNNSFAIAADRAARIAYNVERPVILFSWPSTAKLLQYTVDSGNNEWSQEHFNRLIEELIDLRERTGLKINIVAHSMGNRLVVRSIPIAAGKHLFEQVFLVDPDYDAETFFHYVARYLRSVKKQKQDPAEVTKVRILYSRKDKALPIAQLIFGGYTRLGQGADTALESLFNPTQVPGSVQNATKKLATKLNPVALTSKVPQPAAQSARQRLRDAFEWIDFTAIDHGFVGHTIPYEMIANLWSTGKPGPGLAIASEEAGQVNRMTQVIARYFKQNQRIAELGRCEKIVLVKNTSDRAGGQAISNAEKYSN